MAAGGAAAQTAPSAPQPFIEEQRQQDRERALREQQERAIDVRLPTAPERSAGRLPESEIPCFRIDRLVLEGEHAEDFQWLLREAAGEQNQDSPLGRCLGTQGVNIVLERLQQALIARGWVTSRVLAAPQDLASGTLRLTLVPGRIAAIRFAEGTTDRTSLRTAIPATPGDLLNLRDIEQGLENLKRLPTAEADIQIEPSQAKGAQPGDSDLVVKYSRAQRFLGPLRATLSLDDSGTKSTGRTQGGATLAWDGPLGLNDLAYVSVNHDLFNHDGQRSCPASHTRGARQFSGKSSRARRRGGCCDSAVWSALGLISRAASSERKYSNPRSGQGLTADKLRGSQLSGTGNAEVDAKSAENVATLTSRDANTANGALVNNLTLQQAQDIPRQQQEAADGQRAAQLVGSVIDNVIGDVSAKNGWAEGGAADISAL